MSKDNFVDGNFSTNSTNKSGSISSSTVSVFKGFKAML
jgi:hypothetical protein